MRKTLEPQPFIESLSFDVLHARMTVELKDASLSHKIISAVAQTGMRAEVWTEQESADLVNARIRRQRLILAAISFACLTAALIWQSIISGSVIETVLAHEHHSHVPLPLPIMALYFGAIVSGLWYCLPKALAAARIFRPEMNVLVVISVIGAVVLGEYTEGATVALLFAIANLLETYSVAKARRAIDALLQIAPKQATVLHGHGDHQHEHRVDVDRVPVGSIVRVKPGEKLPFDGTVIAGHSGVDQSVLTGESVPVVKSYGDPVFAGTINTDGVIEICTTTPASDTTIARIFRMVEASEQRRAPIEQWAERFARRYTPVMLGLALGVGLIPAAFTGNWAYWFYQSMVILLISCPCALVISTPVTIVAALASAARMGVLVKGGAFLEVAAHLRAIAFDKTGVLTTGEPTVEGITPVADHPITETLRRVAGIELRSEHPIARALLRHAETQGIVPASVEAFQAHPGRGATAVVEGGNFWIGNRRMAAEQHLSTTALLDPPDAVSTDIACGSNSEVWAYLRLTDQLRAEAPSVVGQLRQEGITKFAVLTGDNHATAQTIARQTGIDEFHAELLPEGKVAVIEKLKAEYGTVAMVGDGINDAQAMSASSLGIALGRRGTDLALESADVILMSDDLSRLPFLISHSRRALKVVKQNVGFALITKAIFLVFAFFGVATLWMAIAADTGATLVVTLNGLRLLRSKA